VVRVPDTPSSFGDATSFEVSELGTTVQLSVRGEIDVASVPGLHNAARRVRLSPGRVVVLDLCDATLVSTAAVELVLGLNAHATAQGCAFVVVVRPEVRELFARAGAEGVRIVADAGEH
jgi:anti-anti-sigma factor